MGCFCHFSSTEAYWWRWFFGAKKWGVFSYSFCKREAYYLEIPGQPLAISKFTWGQIWWRILCPTISSHQGIQIHAMSVSSAASLYPGTAHTVMILGRALWWPEVTGFMLKKSPELGWSHWLHVSESSQGPRLPPMASCEQSSKDWGGFPTRDDRIFSLVDEVLFVFSRSM